MNEMNLSLIPCFPRYKECKMQVLSKLKEVSRVTATIERYNLLPHTTRYISTALTECKTQTITNWHTK